MALTLSDALKEALSKNTIEPMFVLKFEGIPYYFSALPVKEMPKYDQGNIFYDQAGLYYDKPFLSPKSKDYIIAEESSNSITQQIEPDKSGGTSASAMTFKIVDYQQEMSKIISPSFTLDEFLGIGCDVYFTLADGTSFPEDSITVMHGMVEEASGGAGFVRVTIAHPQNLLRQDIIPPWTSKIVTDYFEFSSLVLQANRFFARDPLGNPISIAFVSGGALAVSVVDTGIAYNVQVTIVAGVTTARDVKKIILDTFETAKILDVKTVGDETTIQVVAGANTLTDSNYLKVETVSGLVDDNADAAFKTYVKVKGEILKVTSIDTVNNLIYIDAARDNRGLFNSFYGVTASPEDEVNSFYVFEADAIELSLKLMLSKAEKTTVTSQLWGYVPNIGAVANSVYFSESDIAREFGVTVGDTIDLDSVFTGRQIVDIITEANSSYVIVSGADIGLGSVEKEASFTSKWDTLPIGCGLKTRSVDVEQFEAIKEQYSADIVPYRFYIDESIDMKEFLESELLFPSSLYLIPRKGKISTTITRPATSEGLVFLDSDVVLNPNNVEIGRSVNRYYYNSIKWYYNRDSLETDLFLDKNITVNTDSVQRFKRGVVPLLIESKGLRPDLDSDIYIERATRRFIDRYKNAPEFVNIIIPLAEGITIEVGDAVVFGDSQTQITDTTQGNRNFQPRIFEVLNKQQNKTDVRLFLLETAYQLGASYGTFGPASYLSNTATTGILRLKKSFSTGDLESEGEKWLNYVGQQVAIRTEDWTFYEESKISSILPDKSGFNISPLVSSVAEDMIVEPAVYTDTKNDDRWAKWKSVHCFFNPRVEITLGISTTQFEVSALDQDKFLPNQPVRIHSEDYTIDSGVDAFFIESVVGNLVTLKKALPFTPAAGQFIDLIGFKDGKSPYAFT
jgi:hypothetical protein